MADIILIPKQLRMEWTDVLALDTDLSHVAFRVACILGSHFNRHSGETHIRQDTIAAKMGISERTVWSAIKELEDRGYVLIERNDLGTRPDGRRVCGGRGAANTYLPAFERSQVAATFSGQKLAARCDLLWNERSQNPARKVATHCDPTLASSSKKNPSRARARASQHVEATVAERQQLGDGYAWQSLVEPGTSAFTAWLAYAEAINSAGLLKLLHTALATGSPAAMAKPMPPRLPMHRSSRAPP